LPLLFAEISAAKAKSAIFWDSCAGHCKIYFLKIKATETQKSDQMFCNFQFDG
jgi:hypothetical protein